ncbi:IS30 family transposase [Erysipelothrix sp. HDW6C]|uniref:IS30 family transposase n=1 Tax=Erysipelothrix sp. HDW6C TaxID=2714930 RepID=UPI00140D4209|nr:IS30 family transposase [Erysipelothrix sp. HDW6C]QIK70251.1 IS30 family transposase [Erysipelothrix sp. HDW6C]
MKYKQLDTTMKAQIDVLLATGHSMRSVGRILNISHTTVSRYKNKVYKKRTINIRDKYEKFISYIEKHYDRRSQSIEVCVYRFKKYHSSEPQVSVQNVYNWINSGKLNFKSHNMCYKRSKRKNRVNGMMNHLRWNLDNKTILPIGLRPNHLEVREEIGHLEIDSITGKRNECSTIIALVDRCTRQVWLIKADYTIAYYTSNLIHKYIVDNEITVKSITTDNGKEFETLGITAKKLGVKLYKCDPYCSYQRGSNEHANGIVRRYLPKGKSLIQVEQQYLDDISFKINAMPRKIFDFKAAFEVNSYLTSSDAVEI